MKKRALKKDIYMEIRKTLNRFLSIFLITALGVAFFAGIRASKPDMQLSADAFYDESNLMDLRVLGTLGLTDGDVEAIRQVEGVRDVMPVHSVDMFCQLPEDQVTAQVMSVPDLMNKIQVREGRMPEKENECLVDYKLLTSGKCKLGDTITLKSGSEDSTEDLVNRDTFTVVGAGTTSYYMSLDRGTTSIGSGSLDGFLVVQPSVFVQDFYTQICVTAEGARELTCYTDSYDDLVDELVERMEALEEERSTIRYAEVQKEGAEKIADAEKEIADGERKLEDAGEELEDARVKLADGEKKLADGRREIADGEKELAEKEQELLDGKQEIADGWKKINEAKEKLVLATIQYEKGYAQYEKGKARIDAGLQELEAGRAQYEQAKASLGMLDAGISQAQKGLDLLQPPLYERWQYLTAQENLSAEEQQDLLQLEGLKNQIEQDGKGSWGEKIAGAAAALSELHANRAAVVAGMKQYEDAKAQLDAGAAELAAAKKELDDASDQIDAGNSKAYYGEQDLKEAEAEIADGEQKIADARKELADGKAELLDAEKEYEDALKEFRDGEQEYEDARVESEEEIADARVKIADAKEELADLEQPKWYVLDRQYIQTYVEYGSDADRIGAIGEVFPVIFFLVAALVSLTTMTRMVEEQRTQIGTLKALGYGKGAIAAKYIIYALASSLTGSLLGLVVGQKILPEVIIGAYKILYNNLPVTLTPLNLRYSVAATLVAVLCTTGAALLACYKELNAVPAQLMRPAAPKAGKRVFLEYLPFLWRRLNFSQKAAVRNLIRYKKRFFMTVFGIGGCMALLLVGFGLKDSILTIGDGQYGEVFSYSGSIGIDKDAAEEERDALLSKVANDKRITHSMEARETAMDVEKAGVTKSAQLIVPRDPEELNDYIHLQDRESKESYALEDDSVIISEKLARLLEVSEGDQILLKEDDTEQVEVTVAHITENYFQHYIYMTKELYEKLYGEAPVWNEILLRTTQTDEEFEKAMQLEYMEADGVLDLTFISGTAERVANMLKSMDLVIYVLVVSAALLAFVVLYNLNNININERQRELATLKVLGFYDDEVSTYVNRENVMLTLIGAAVGVLMGIALHRFVLVTAEIDILMFGRIIAFRSYGYSILLTFVFSAIVNWVMFFKLRAINMVESLKSVE